jgi:hypothetical protein
MEIKGADGHSYHVTGQGQGNFNTAGAIAGIASLLGFDLGNLGVGMRNGAVASCSENQFVNRYELNLVEQLNAKDSHIALLEADKYTDQKIVEAYKDLQGQIRGVEAQVLANKDAQAAINLQQATMNATATATISCMQGQIAQLQSLSQLVIPAKNVCDLSCNQ